METLEAFQAAARERGFVAVEEGSIEVEKSEAGNVLWLRKETQDAATRTHQLICIDSDANILTVYWMTAPGKIDSKTFRSASSLQEWFAAQPAEMSNREAILRLSVDTGDQVALAWLRDHNAEILRSAVSRYFAAGPAADKAESMLMERLANHARSYQHQDDPDEWLARCVNAECDRLRNEAIHDKANSD